MQLAGQAAGRADDHPVLADGPLDGTDRLRVRRQRIVGRCAGRGIRGTVPVGFQPLVRQCEGEIAKGRVEIADGRPCVADHGDRVVLGRVEGGRVDRHQPGIRVPEQAPGTGGEVLQPGADGEDQIRRPGDGVGGLGSGNADGADAAGVGPGQRRLAGLGFGDRDAVPFGEGGEPVAGLGVVDPAAGDDEGRPGGAKRGSGTLQLARIGALAAHGPCSGPEECLGIVAGLRLHVLAQRQGDRAAFGRIDQRRHRPRQGRKKLLRTGDAIEVAAHGTEAVVGADGAVLEVLDLLQDRIGDAAREDVARQQQHRQAVHVRQRRRRDHVRRTRPDRRRHRHEPLAVVGLRVGDRRVGHALLVVATPCRQRSAGVVEGLAEPGDVSVTEDRPHPGDEPDAVLVRLRPEIAHEGLGRRQSDGAHRPSSPMRRVLRPTPRRAR